MNLVGLDKPGTSESQEWETGTLLRHGIETHLTPLASSMSDYASNE